MSKDPIQEIKDLANIIDLVSEIIPVKRSGSSYVAVCPFHNDTRPSMHISASKGIFKCFSCGAGGDIFKFWSDYYKKDFAETLKDLANKYGVQLEAGSHSREDTERFNIKIKMHELAAKFYHEQLLGSNAALKARQYLEERAISTNIVNSFCFGYSPEEQDRLIKILKETLQVSDEEIVSAGLALKSENNGSYFDRFRSRLMIPIYDERSRVIGFGARILDKDSKLAKYINSPETEIYNKGSHLFGLNLAKEEIRKKDAVILVEGYFDLISLYQAGFRNVVANQGTALTPKQVKMLSKYTQSKRIYLCFDSDSAGQTAAERALEVISSILKNMDYEIRIIKVPNGKDPDDFIRTNSAEAFQGLISSAPIFIEYKINEIIHKTDLASSTDKIRSIKEISKYLSFVDNKILFAEYRKLIAEKLQVNELDLAEELEKIIKPSDNPYADPALPKQEFAPKANLRLGSPRADNHVEKIEQELIVLFLIQKSFLENFVAEGTTLLTQSYNRILDKIIDISFENPDLIDPEEKYSLVFESFLEDRELNYQLTEIGLKLEANIRPEELHDYYLSQLKRLKEESLKQKISFIKAEITQLDSESEAQMNKILEKNNLEKELHSLKS